MLVGSFLILQWYIAIILLDKSYTATAIGIAVTEKKLSLDEKMVDIFKDEIEEKKKICVPN